MSRTVVIRTASRADAALCAGILTAALVDDPVARWLIADQHDRWRIHYRYFHRDPLPWWGTGAVTLLGDAAHPMYPYGGNGVAQAILDARALAHALAGSAIVTGGLAEYEAQRRPATTEVVLVNRRGGPEACLDLVEQRAPTGFERIADVISAAELAEITSRYQQIADHTTGSADGCH